MHIGCVVVYGVAQIYDENLLHLQNWSTALVFYNKIFTYWILLINLLRYGVST